MLIRICILIALTCAFYSPCIEAATDVSSHNKVVVCYVASWAAYRPDSGAFNWTHIDPTLCTHIVYAFAVLDNVTNTINTPDAWLDLEDGGGRAQYKKLMMLKDRRPGLKITLAIGGWNEGSTKYSEMASTPESRAKFVASTVAFIRQHGFDGVDMDWEYPSARGGVPEDKANFVQLLSELRKELDKYKKILTVALAANPQTVDNAYDVPAISRYVDYLHLMCYDYHGSWDGQVGHNAPLRLPGGVHLSEDHRLSVENTVMYYAKLGAPRAKMVLGMPFYGRTFTLVDPAFHDIGMSSQGAGFQGPYTREPGFLGYNEICKDVGAGGWEQDWDDVAESPYMRSEQRWVSYDDEKSISIKAKYAHDQQLAGAMIWAIDNDDFKGECGGLRYPLLNGINEAFRQAEEEDRKHPTTKPDVSTPAPEPVAPAAGASCASLNILLSLFATVIVLQL